MKTTQETLSVLGIYLKESSIQEYFDDFAEKLLFVTWKKKLPKRPCLFWRFIGKYQIYLTTWKHRQFVHFHTLQYFWYNICIWLETIEYFFFVSVCLYYEIYSTCIASFLSFTKTRMFMQIHVRTLSVALGVIYISDIERIHIIW